MERLHSGAPMPAHLRGSIMALGNFDGFHAGHQAVARRAIELARAQGRPAVIATFDPHPMRLFRPETPWFRLTTLDQRERLFARAGADAMLVFDFTRELAALDPLSFVRLLVDWGVAGVVTGEDFTFGKDRAGSTRSLAQLGAPLGLAAEAVPPVTGADGEIISSTRIRKALQSGDCATATRLLTRPFAIEGVVQHGDKLGRTIGFPTANIDLGHYLRPAYGIYAVRGLLADGRVLDGAANLGIRPSFDPPKELLEPHFLDFAENLYDQRIEVQLIHYLRPEAKYDGLDALMAAIAKDCDDARQILAGTPHLA
ncbi:MULTISPECIES: bifunctional riboflavin kinase/FAD synthetase [Sphingobium]|jgi:riboflavin kinase/FMN adenylyltransferase|uniref:Riboflavin biosynthesis protein n=1 Tax=Sphingobium fuliginis (strain ATCC 27551) TaxID=336203 RepID=A0A292ZCA4_SPHSA|nr:MULTISPECIES: bifunctional riboflavin kinase/FAD synthetase [Sphingobium]OAP32824.1 riboflavin biosynthesis protein RibF [Sphingobium sp. 20006FA]AJR25723.1 riboflavin biosynthesis protein RibF [Sphingobium sp. YBL2]KXU32441.1 bifunctional riboflavin kinase/FMN adenylyltransferase [Sphingobium sp. AM]KYC32498.1 bifunctional riboflavin kinase/FMN adenylyltransferase [Sphingobium sp. 22B]PNQ04650.1 riboflavin biosynthesis protein RibF [Sphingobium sp. SA916]